MILLTTSRRPTGGIRTLCRDLAFSLPDIVRVNRGKMSLNGIAERAIELDANRVVMVDRWRGGPGKISLFKIASSGLIPVPPLMLIAGVRLHREFKEAPRSTRSSVITMEPEDSLELEKIAAFLSQFFRLPVLSIYIAAEKHSSSMHFSFDFQRHPQITFLLLQQRIEIGPRVTLSKLVW